VLVAGFNAYRYCSVVEYVKTYCHNFNYFAVMDAALVTFRVSRRRREMYSGHACLSASIPTLLHGPRCKLGSGRGCHLVVHYWAYLQSVHGLRCYVNITRTQNVSEYTFLYSFYA